MEEKTSTGTSHQERILDSASGSQGLTKNASAQNFFSSVPYHAAFAFLIPLLVTTLGVYAQGRKKNLFETHAANIWIFLLSTLIYCFAFTADLKYQHHQTQQICGYSQLFSSVAIVSGSLASASVVSILLGDIIFVLWASVPIIVAYQHANSIKNAYNWLLQKNKNTISKFWGIRNWFKDNSLVEQPQLPV